VDSSGPIARVKILLLPVTVPNPIMIKLYKNHLVAAVALVSGLLPCGLSAATVTSATSSSAPAAGIIQSFVPAGGTAGWSWRADSSLPSDSWRDTGQSFIAATNFTLNAITLRSNIDSGVNSPALNAAFTLTIYRFESIFHSTPSATLATYTGLTPSSNLESGNLANGTYVTFALSEGLQLTQGGVYGFVFHYDTKANGRSFVFSVTTTNNEYADGRNLSVLNDDNGAPLSSAFTRNGNSMEFHLAGTTSIPEPGTFALLASASALAFAGARRRR
jgi:hypothetical protein